MNSLPFLKGVNLGGWLVTERWMTPSLYEGTDAQDEYTFLLDPENHSKLGQHRQSFITGSDFEWLASVGVNAIRIPVGYWIFEGDSPFLPSIEFLDWGIEQSKKHDLFVLIDLHAAPGSQNGKDHSGKIGKVDWYNEENLNKTLEVLLRLVQRYKDEDHVFGIELINEPKLDFFNYKLRRFYNKAYEEITKIARPGFHVVFHDAFKPKLLSGAIKNINPDFPVILDNHHYGFFSDIVAKTLSVESYFKQLEKRDELYETIEKDQKVIVGEWSYVLSGNILVNRKSEEMDLMTENGRIQKSVYQKSTAGWFFWSYKTESPGIWNFRSLVEDGLLTI